MASLSEMLKIQERMYKSLFESALNTVTARLDEPVCTVTERKTSLEFTQQDVDHLKPKVDQLHEVEQEIDNIQVSIDDQRGKLTYLENQSRRNNLRIDGIPEEEGETWETSEQKVKEAIKNKLRLQIDVNIERTHRVGKRLSNRGRSDKPRTIVCRLRDWKQKEPILKVSTTVKTRGIFVNEDFAYATIQRRKELLQLRAAKQAGKIAYFVVD